MITDESVKKVAVLSDIHSNYIALETCVNHALKQGIKNIYIFRRLPWGTGLS